MSGTLAFELHDLSDESSLISKTKALFLLLGIPLFFTESARAERPIFPCSGMDIQREVAYFLYDEVEKKTWEGTNAALRLLDLDAWCKVTRVDITGHASIDYEEKKSFEVTLHFMNRAYQDILATGVAPDTITMSYLDTAKQSTTTRSASKPPLTQYGRIEIVAHLEEAHDR